MKRELTDLINRIRECFSIKQQDRLLSFLIKCLMMLICIVVFIYAYIFRTYRCMFLLGGAEAIWIIDLIMTRKRIYLYVDIVAATLSSCIVDTLFLSGDLKQVGAFLLLFTAIISVFMLGLFWGNILGIFNLIVVGVTFNIESFDWIREKYTTTFCERFPYILLCFFVSAVFLQYGITRRQLMKQNYRAELNKMIDEGKAEQTKISLNILLSMFKALSTKSPEVGKHCEATAEWSRLIARGMGYDKHEARRMYYAGLLHDIGKIGVTDAYWLKGSMSKEKKAEYYRHVDIGYDIVRKLNLQQISDAAEYHHEYCNGKGYKGLKRYEIPEAARIVALADYLAHLDHEEIPYERMIDMVEATSDKKYDGDIVAVAIKVIRDMIKKAEEDAVFGVVDQRIQ